MIESRGFTAKMKIENRGGKTVTVIEGLPKLEIFLKDLTKKLKNRCGSGGTYRMDGKEGVVEIQGDKRDQIRTLLESDAITVKG